MADRARVEQALVLLDTYNRQIEALSQQLGLLQAVLDETIRARDTLEGLRQEPRKEILVPLGANTFIYAHASETDRVLSGMGASYSIEKPWQEAESRLSERSEQLREELQRLTETAVRLQAEAARLQDEIQGDLSQMDEQS